MLRVSLLCRPSAAFSLDTCRLAASGKVSTIQDDWDDMQLDALLLTHCSNTPAAAATRAIAKAAAAGSSSVLRTSKSGSRRTRADLEIDPSAGEAAAADDAYNFEGAAMSPATRRVRPSSAAKAATPRPVGFAFFPFEFPLLPVNVNAA